MVIDSDDLFEPDEIVTPKMIISEPSVETNEKWFDKDAIILKISSF